MFGFFKKAPKTPENDTQTRAIVALGRRFIEMKQTVTRLQSQVNYLKGFVRRGESAPAPAPAVKEQPMPKFLEYMTAHAFIEARGLDINSHSLAKTANFACIKAKIRPKVVHQRYPSQGVHAIGPRVNSYPLHVLDSAANRITTKLKAA